MSDVPYEYIADNAALEALCKRLEGATYLVLDTEFLRERTYRPELCLIQIKYRDTLAIVDAQTVTDLAPLVERLLDTSTVKVLHAASQDLEIFWMMSRRVPSPVFDTQLAAPLLGHAEQIGYANLCRAILDLEIDKSQTRADWTRRPLPEKQIKYALDDVIHLEDLYLTMRSELEQLGRLDWLEPEFRAIEAVGKYDQPARERWKRVRQITRYKGAALACIQALAEWREIKARETNQPRNWLLKDEVLTSLAQQQPTDLDELGHIRGLDRRTRERYGEEIVALLSDARETDPEPLPPFRKKLKNTPATEARIQLLDAWVHQRAAELDIAPGLLAPPSLLEKFIAGEGRATLSGWRDPLIGEALQQLVDGEVALRATKGGLVLA